MRGDDVVSRVAVFDDVEADEKLLAGTRAGHFADGFVVFVEDLALDGADDAAPVLPLRTLTQFVTFGPFHDELVRQFALLLLDEPLDLRRRKRRRRK